MIGMSDVMISVGWVALDNTGNVLQPTKPKQWYNDSRTNSVRKLYKTEAVARRYGTPKEVFMKIQESDG